METDIREDEHRDQPMRSGTVPVVFVVNNIPNQEGRTRYQHAIGLCEAFETTIVSRQNVPDDVREPASKVHTFPESVLPERFVFFPLWLFYWTVRIRPAATVVSPHSLYITITFIGARLSSSNHVVDIWDDLNLPVASYSGRLGLRYRLLELYHRAHHSIARPCLRRTDLVILSIHRGVIEKYDLPSGRVLELTNGVNPALFSIDTQTSDARSRDGVRMVYLGRANEKRNVHSVINSVANALPSSQLDIVGATDETVRQAAAKHNNVTLHGERPYKEALDIVRRADIGLCVLDTSIENYRYSYPIKVFEYAALGKAIIASDTVGVRSLLTEGESVLFIDDASESDLKRAVTELAEDPEFRRSLGRNAREEIREFTWPKILDRYTAGIKELIVNSDRQ